MFHLTMSRSQPMVNDVKVETHFLWTAHLPILYNSSQMPMSGHSHINH